MDAKLKARWVKALRSGRFKQGMGQLRTKTDNRKTEYCCLGVLCEITQQKRGVHPGYVFDGKYHNGGIPPQSQLGKQLETEGLNYHDLINKLTSMNDGNWEKPYRSFRGIAQWIERNL